MTTKSFRGRIDADSMTSIALHTNNGSIGYKIKMLQVIGQQPSALDQESTFKIFTIPQTAPSSTIDFSDNTMIAAAFYETEDTSTLAENQTVIFDNVKFNQDIYLTMKGTPSVGLNYYIELEVVKLALDENTVATLKDIRNIAQSSQ